ncbi:CotO family spore coat protein [Thalassobacillus pellis]|uniref:CotO family spore coat protein n=1 Tax=Thalassobacillus pellis TaxID=748008 RepID=UPI0019620CCB|nr:CotO family spore coat protein [Thalassobacillus pellis]MBM7554006.1 hypothetical protein [Thalassobacillus pellis]
MAKQKKLVQEPMFYITQPKLTPSTASMQTMYHSRKSSEAPVRKEKEVTPVEKEVRHRQLAADSLEAEQKSEGSLEEREEREEEMEESSVKTRRDRRRRFRDMDLEEKIFYFVNLPSQVPKMKCEVVTNTDRFKGYINDYRKGIVYMKTFQRPFKKEIAFEDIEEISLMGF